LRNHLSHQTTIKGQKKNDAQYNQTDPEGNYTALTELIGEPPMTISRQLRRYQDEGLIKRQCSKKTGIWIFL
jgi:hypothetical protein